MNILMWKVSKFIFHNYQINNPSIHKESIKLKTHSQRDSNIFVLHTGLDCVGITVVNETRKIPFLMEFVF